MFGPENPIGIGDTIKVYWKYKNLESDIQGVLKCRDGHLWSVAVTGPVPNTIVVVNTMNVNLKYIELLESYDVGF